jgi:pimeloyl-ACP methyl ester carboxylesterase
MPVANVRGANINYEVLGTHGPWVALSPGGRRALDNVKPLAQHVADRGYRVLIHDRRNCGVSDIVIGGDKSQYEVWADDLYALPCPDPLVPGQKSGITPRHRTGKETPGPVGRVRGR